MCGPGRYVGALRAKSIDGTRLMEAIFPWLFHEDLRIKHNQVGDGDGGGRNREVEAKIRYRQRLKSWRGEMNKQTHESNAPILVGNIHTHMGNAGGRVVKNTRQRRHSDGDAARRELKAWGISVPLHQKKLARELSKVLRAVDGHRSPAQSSKGR